MIIYLYFIKIMKKVQVNLRDIAPILDDHLLADKALYIADACKYAGLNRR